MKLFKPAAGFRGALERNEFSTRFQPIVEAESGRIVGGELLLRWHPQAGEVSPDIFIPIAESIGEIGAIGAWVFQQGCNAEVEWRRRWGAMAPYVSINVSTRQLTDLDLVDQFIATLERSGAEPARILLEITETAMMAEAEANLVALHRLAHLGFRIAIDDFGTGYSSLAQLTRMPVDVLKIDRAFVDRVNTNREILTVARSIIALAGEFNLKIIAEGVETAEQRSVLITNGCGYMQGYLFYRPLEQAGFMTAVDAQRGVAYAESLGQHHFILYVSQATQEFDQAGLQEIVRQASLSNRGNEITGFLIYQDGYFLQLLEGREDRLHALLERISHDPRHKNVRICLEGKKRRRLFPDWSMGCRNISSILGDIDFEIWEKRTIPLFELADDPRTSYAFIAAFSDRNVLVTLGLDFVADPIPPA